jgi:RoxA-like, cytochrome c-like
MPNAPARCQEPEIQIQHSCEKLDFIGADADATSATGLAGDLRHSRAERRRQRQTLFKDQCESCHASIDRTDLKSEIRIKQTWLRDSETPKTDLAMTCNAYGKRAKTGVLQGTVTPRDPHKLENEAPVRDMVQVTIGGAINNQQWAVMKGIALSFLRLQPDPVVIPFVGGSGSDDTEAVKAFGKAKALSEWLQAGRGYKARPLNGIWATAPYLHNGSVPTLYDLLLPADNGLSLSMSARVNSIRIKLGS